MEQTASVRVLTPSQVEAEYGITKQALANKRWRGEGPAYVKGKGRCGRVRYFREDIEAWLHSNRIDPEEAA